jgi:hypothetical protein
VLDRVLEKIEDASPPQTGIALAIVAALGDTKTASRLSASFSPKNAIQRYSHELLAAVIAIGEDRLQDASEHLRSLAAIVREYAIPLGEPSCLTGFAALAASRGDYETASRHLATVKAEAQFPFRSPADALLYRQTARTLRNALDPSTASRCRAEGAATAVSRALDDELAQHHDEC